MKMDFQDILSLYQQCTLRVMLSDSTYLLFTIAGIFVEKIVLKIFMTDS